MPTVAPCERCSDPAVTHITDSSAHHAITSHYCERHTPSEYRQTIDSLACSTWKSPVDREAAIDFIANEVDVSREEVRQALQAGFDQMDRPIR